jgi:prolyl oligopeptidase
MRTFIFLIVMVTPVFAQPPSARRVEQVDDYHGTKVADPYRWLEDLDSTQTKQWVEAERAYTEKWFAEAPERSVLLARMRQLWSFDRMPTFTIDEQVAGYVVREKRVFFLRQTGLQNQPVLYVRDTPQAQPRVLLDVNALAADGTTALATLAVSPDGRRLAYGLARAGSDWQQWQVRDVETGKDLPERLEWIKFSSPAWTADSKGFFYCRFPKPAGDTLTGVNEDQQIYYHRLTSGQTEDRLVYQRPDHKDWIFSPAVSEDGRYLVIRVEHGTESKHLLFYQDLQAGDGKTHELIDEFYAAQQFLGNDGRRFYVRTTFKAPKGRVVAVDLDQPAREDWGEVVPETSDTLQQATMEGSWLVLNYLKDATNRVRVQPVKGSGGYDVPLPANSTVTLAEHSRRFFSVTSFMAPETVYECSGGGSCRPVERGRLPFDPSLLETRQVFYESKDGTKIPMFLVYRKGMKVDGNNPALLYGYGGFDISITPGFSPRFLAWMNMGGVLAVANLRGGGEYGETWHQAGMKQKKQNVFDDFIAAGEWLIANRYTSSKKLAVAGGSNGGLLVGAVLNQRPDLFGAAIPAVGVMDMLRFHKFTIGAAWATEYGAPDNLEDFRTIYAYSPLHNIRTDTEYPSTLILTADHDDRVVPGHSFKYAATLQQAQKGKAPILIRIETAAGHGGGKPTGKRIEEDADVLTFLAKTFGMDVK